jgi:hypothetical protein
MKLSDTNTNYLLIKASTDSEWDDSQFAVVHITDAWKSIMRTRLDQIHRFRHDNDFSSLSWWDYSASFYRSTGNEDDDQAIAEFLESENWSFVFLDEGETAKFTRPENRLVGYKFCLYKDGTAAYNAFGKHTDERFGTEDFPLSAIL